MIKVRAVDELKNKYPGGDLHIVGKGPSLCNVTAGNFGDGPVITMNESILIIQDLGLNNDIYSMQKDGLAEVMVRPKNNIWLILQDPGFSEMYFPDHPRRLYLDPVIELGFQEPSVMSVRMCIALGRVMGCKRITMISCDSLVGDLRTLDVTQNKITRESVTFYQAAIPDVKKELGEFEFNIVTPIDVTVVNPGESNDKKSIPG